MIYWSCGDFCDVLVVVVGVVGYIEDVVVVC